MPSSIDRRIYVVGVPRSGTTLVQSLLAAHSEVTSFTESHLFSRHYRLISPLAAAVLVESPLPRLRAFVAENDDGLEIRHDVIEDAEAAASWPTPLLPWRSRRVARHLVRVFDRLALARGLGTWVEKTAQHLRYVPFLERLHVLGDRPHVVHVIREGIDVVASLHAASRSWSPRGYRFAVGPTPPYDVDTCARRWNRDLAFSLSRSPSPRDHFVFYEDVTSRPEATLRTLFGRLGLTWEPEVLQTFSTISNRLITASETWKRVGVELTRSHTAEETMTAAERARVTSLLRVDLYDRLRECSHASDVPEPPHAS